MDKEVLINKAREYLLPEKVNIIQQAFDFAVKAHERQVRESGEPYVEHSFAVAMMLVNLQLDAGSVAAALLHDVSEDCQVPLSEIEKQFGSEVSKLVDGVTKLGKINLASLNMEVLPGRGTEEKEAHAENLRKMLVAMAEDVRVVLIKLADRLHNMTSLDNLAEDRRQRIARETMDIYAPLAHRLGMWDIKWQLEDLAFRQLDPTNYHIISNLLAGRRSERDVFIGEVCQVLKAEFKKANIEADVTGRAKHIYSIQQKIKKYEDMGKQFDDIHDLLAVRVLVSSKGDCYAALGVVHSLWHPLAGEFNDFIANHKDNGYQSLHTTILYRGTIALEVQIRTREMHAVDEFGIAAHWRYKEGDKQSTVFTDKITWLRQLMDWHREISGSQEFLESVRTDILGDQVFVYTPKGEIKDLPKGATPLDFAFTIHTDLGNRCIGAKVNGRLMPLDYELSSGDTVEIITSKWEKGPNRDWLNPSLGFIKTLHARRKIRQWFLKQERNENIEKGKQLIEKELKRLGLSLEDAAAMATSLKSGSVEDFWASLGCGEITPHQVIQRLIPEEEHPRVEPEFMPLPGEVTGQVEVLGVGDLLTHLARCCHPLPGDEIIGYVTRISGVTIHRKNCRNILNEDEKERLIDVKWGMKEQLYPVGVTVEARDRVGLLNDISSIVAGEKVNIAAVKAEGMSDRTTSIFLRLNIRNIQQLSRILVKLESIKGVLSASRSRGGIIKSSK